MFTSATNENRKGLWSEGVRIKWLDEAFVFSPMHSVKEEKGLFDVFK